jgi:hypothetical protein
LCNGPLETTDKVTPFFAVPLRKGQLEPGAILEEFQCAATLTGPRLHYRLVGGSSKQGAKARPQPFQRSGNLHCVVPAEGEK